MIKIVCANKLSRVNYMNASLDQQCKAQDGTIRVEHKRYFQIKKAIKSKIINNCE
mgnify:CR=1 FL=1